MWLNTMVHCPFCGVEEKERLKMEGKLIIIFPCMFSPMLESGLNDIGIQKILDERYGSKGQGWFEDKCEQLHLFVKTGNKKHE